MIGVFVFPLCLLLPSVVRSEFPDFGDDYDYYDDYFVCEGDACAWRTIDLGIDKTIQVPNKTVTIEEYEYLYVDTAGLLADCAPSLSIGDIASNMKSCKEVNWKYQDACRYMKKGWLDQDGKTVNESLGTDFKEIEGVSENIMKCLAWDGVDDYDDYYDYYWDDPYDYGLEESDDVQVRAKREQKPNVPEFMIQKTRLKRSTDDKANIRKEENRRVKKRGNRKRKNKGKFGRKSVKKGKKSGKKGKKHGPRRKQSARKGKKGGKFRQKSGKKYAKGRRNSGKRKHKGAKKANKRKKNGRNKKKKGNNKNNENKKKKEERQKKKKEMKLLKELGYDSMPSKEIVNKLDCVERAIQYGLEKCGEKIFENL